MQYLNENQHISERMIIVGIIMAERHGIKADNYIQIIIPEQSVEEDNAGTGEIAHFEPVMFRAKIASIEAKAIYNTVEISFTLEGVNTLTIPEIVSPVEDPADSEETKIRNLSVPITDVLYTLDLEEQKEKSRIFLWDKPNNPYETRVWIVDFSIL